MLIELLRRAAREAPERAAVISDRQATSYADLLAGSEALARGLAREGVDRFGIAVADPVTILIALAASSAIGSEACVYPADVDDLGLDELAAEFDHEVVIADPAADLVSARAETIANLSLDHGPDAVPSDDAPVLVLTTGTTGRPKGARHDWNRLLSAVRKVDDEPGRRWLLVYNLNQFAGIQIVLHVLASRGTLVVPPSRQPRDAIEAIRDSGVTHVSATPTFWRMVAGRLNPESARELPLEQITLGGEAAPGPLLERLVELFPDARVTHIYAGTEFGTVMSASDGLAGFPLSVLDRGEDSAARLRIVDGELHMRSRGGMLGYHAGGDSAGDWRPTGDLVEIRDDRLHFVGRKSDVINVGGAKVHPLPIEEAVAAVDGVELATAYGHPNPITGQIVAIDVVAAPGADTEALEAAIREACAELPRAGRPRRIRFVDEIEMRGDKLARPAGEAAR